MGWVRFLHKICPVLDCFFQRYLIPKGLLLFSSPYMNNEEIRLTFPLTNQKQWIDCCFSNSTRYVRNNSGCEVIEPTTNVGYFKQKFRKMFGYDENFGSEDFLENARNILIKEKRNKMERRRQEMEQRRRKKRREEKEKRMKRVESLLENAVRLSLDSNIETSISQPRSPLTSDDT